MQPRLDKVPKLPATALIPELGRKIREVGGDFEEAISVSPVPKVALQLEL